MRSKDQMIQNLTTERDACHQEVALLRAQVEDTIRLLHEEAADREYPRIEIGAVGEAFREAARMLANGTGT